MKKIYRPIVFASLGCITLLCACTHIPTDIKAASKRQAQGLADFETKLKEQDLGTKCFESLKASIEMEKTLEERGEKIQALINKNFADSMSRANSFKDIKTVAEKEAQAARIMIEQTMALQKLLAEMRVYTEEERNKCKNALETVQDIVHSLAVSQADLDKFIQADARTPLEEFLLNLAFVKLLEQDIQSSTDNLQDKMTEFAQKLQAIESAVK